MLTLGSTEKSCVARKTVVSNKKKIFHIEVYVAQQNYVSHRKVCYGNNKNYVTPKRRLMLTKCLVLHRKGICVYKKMVELIKKVLCRTKNTLCRTKNKDGA